MGLNKDFISVETYINHHEVYKYDSYIFGNSRSMFYKVNDWKKHINSDRCFHFDASNESIYGIERKFQFLEDKGAAIKNALIVLDQDELSIIENGKDHFDEKDPELSKENKIMFQLRYLQDFAESDFFCVYVYFLFAHKLTPKMEKKGLFTYFMANYDCISNEISFPNVDSQIEKNKYGFYAHRMYYFYDRGNIQKYSNRTIGLVQQKMLKNIKRILVKNNTVFRIVISPLYNQLKFDTTDLKTMYSIFGKENVYDFSGINDITQDMYNYYEYSHYRPFIANRIMDTIYKNNVLK